MKNNDQMKTQQENMCMIQETAAYEKPAIEVIEMETEGCILAGSGGDFGGGGGTPGWN